MLSTYLNTRSVSTVTKLAVSAVSPCSFCRSEDIQTCEGHAVGIVAVSIHTGYRMSCCSLQSAGTPTPLSVTQSRCLAIKVEDILGGPRDLQILYHQLLG